MAKKPELLTLDLNIARDFLDHGRAHHAEAVSLFELNGTAVELAMGPQGTLLDANGQLRGEVAQLCRDENIGELRQLAYLSEATFLSDDLYLGQLVEGFQDDWAAAIANWKPIKGARPSTPTTFMWRPISSTEETYSLRGTAAYSPCAIDFATSSGTRSRP